MDQLNRDYANLLTTDHEPPCLSLYQPTHRHNPDKLQDPIRFRNLIKAMSSALRNEYGMRKGPSLLRPFYALADDRDFWNHVLRGLAVLASPGFFKFYRLQRPVPERVVVADSFHTKPLLRILQSADRYQILGLNRRQMRLFEGNRDELDEIESAAAVPRSIDDLVSERHGQPERRNRIYGAAVSGATTRHGTDVKEEEREAETEMFFRAVDRGVLEHHSQPTGMPLVLAALPQYHHLFRALSRNPFLLSNGIDVFPDAISLEELRERAWQIIRPFYLDRLMRLKERFLAARSRGLSSDELGEIAVAAGAGRVESLLIEAERTIPGTYDPATGSIAFSNTENVDDLLDDVGEQVIKTGGDVVVVPVGQMPTDTGIAANYRF
jgi:hypothetical protein